MRFVVCICFIKTSYFKKNFILDRKVNLGRSFSEINKNGVGSKEENRVLLFVTENV